MGDSPTSHVWSHCLGYPSLFWTETSEKWRPGLAWQTIPQDMGTFSQHCAKPNLVSGSKGCAVSGAGRYGVFRHQIFFRIEILSLGQCLVLLDLDGTWLCGCYFSLLACLLHIPSSHMDIDFVYQVIKGSFKKLPCYGYDGQDGMEWNGMEWNGMEWNGMDSNGLESNGIEWHGLEWNGMEWHGMARKLPVSDFEGSLAWKLRFHIFSIQILRDVSHESFVSTSSTFTFGRKSRTKASFSHLQL